MGGGQADNDGDEAQAGTIVISASDLPRGQKPAVGDVLPFRVTGINEDGDIELAFEGKGGRKGNSWDDEFRAAMSPRSNKTPQT